jgi:hypothetical protein
MGGGFASVANLVAKVFGVLRRGVTDQGIPVGQIFYPPYPVATGGGRATRPAITSAPRQISYRGHFDVKVSGSPGQIGSGAILRRDHNTHSLTAGDRYVKLAFQQKGDARKGELRVVAPKLPAQAVPGTTCCLSSTRMACRVPASRFDWSRKPGDRASSSAEV